MAPYYEYAAEQLPRFWEAQSRTLDAVPHVGMVVTSDISEWTDIHPRDKLDVPLSNT